MYIRAGHDRCGVEIIINKFTNLVLDFLWTAASPPEVRSDLNCSNTGLACWNPKRGVDLSQVVMCWEIHCDWFILLPRSLIKCLKQRRTTFFARSLVNNLKTLSWASGLLKTKIIDVSVMKNIISKDIHFCVYFEGLKVVDGEFATFGLPRIS